MLEIDSGKRDTWIGHNKELNKSSVGGRKEVFPSRSHLVMFNEVFLIMVGIG